MLSFRHHSFHATYTLTVSINAPNVPTTVPMLNTKASMKAFMRYSESLTASPFHHAEPNVPLTLRETRLQVQNMIKNDTSLIVETGDRYLVLHPDMSYAGFHL